MLPSNTHQQKNTIPYIAGLYFTVVAGCSAGPTRADLDGFKLLQKGQVPVEHTQAFTDCLMDGFNKAHWTMTNTNIRQQRRAECYRVESLVNSSILVSADIFDDGRVQLLESKNAVLINTTGERKAFADCVSRFPETR